MCQHNFYTCTIKKNIEGGLTNNYFTDNSNSYLLTYIMHIIKSHYIFCVRTAEQRIYLYIHYIFWKNAVIHSFVT